MIYILQIDLKIWIKKCRNISLRYGRKGMGEIMENQLPSNNDFLSALMSMHRNSRRSHDCMNPGPVTINSCCGVATNQFRIRGRNGLQGPGNYIGYCGTMKDIERDYICPNCAALNMLSSSDITSP
ncbi:hypothetical protein FGO68_gene4605 [Halteria grandinella]|uniref:Uncharacterized protein n=1 Tax=Halteria grandinella TaxID=5974 RepID=A0A8J8NIS8_HALGN|nr:hypothetical protein FGO68_gene4605 [Halteria grandinella]